MTNGGPATAHAERAVVVAAATVTALAPLNSTMIAVALPEIVHDLGIGVGAAGWLITTYLFAMGAGQPVAGRLGDRIGRRRLMAVGLTGFGLASLGAGLAPAFPVLLLFRVLQAVTGAAMMPNAAAMVRSVLPADRRASGFGVMGAAIGLSAAAGPLLGAALLAVGGWRAVFLANVPVVAAAAVALRRVPAEEREIPAGHAAGAPTTPDVGIFRSPGFRAAAGGTALSNLSLYTLLVAVPLLLDTRGWDASSGAIVLAAMTVGMSVMAPLGGRLADRVGRRRPAVMGLWLLAAAIVPLALVPRDLHGALLACSLAAAGVGFGLSTASLQTAALESVSPSRAGTAAGLFSTLRYTGSFIGTVVLSVLLQAGDQYAAVFAMALGTAVLAAVVAARIPVHPGLAPRVTVPRADR